MSFTLISQRTGLRKTFTIRDILNIFGNVVDDEVFLGEDVFNLSSYQETQPATGGNDGSALPRPNPAGLFFDLQGTHAVITFQQHGNPAPFGIAAYDAATGEMVALGCTIDSETKAINIYTNSSMNGLRACVL